MEQNCFLNSADYARNNNWQVGDVIDATEALRVPVAFKITAIGTQLVLGVPVRNKVEEERETVIHLKNTFTMWRKTNG